MFRSNIPGIVLLALRGSRPLLPRYAARMLADLEATLLNSVLRKLPMLPQLLEPHVDVFFPYELRPNEAPGDEGGAQGLKLLQFCAL